MRRWYVAYTHVGAENLAEGHLARQGFEAYLPRYVKQVRHARKSRAVKAPLFPRYIFVSIDLETQRWRAINGTQGISHLVAMGSRPNAVPDGVVEEIQCREGDDRLIEVWETPPFETGDAVEVTSGALAEQVGRFLRADTAERVVLLMDILGRGIEVKLPNETVRAYA